jgi:hypothetical protein
MDTDTYIRQVEALGIAESIAMRIRSLMSGESSAKFSAEEYADMARTLGDIEDRLFKNGEYAPQNVARVKRIGG